jgi:hypothetical protein
MLSRSQESTSMAMIRSFRGLAASAMVLGITVAVAACGGGSLVPRVPQSAGAPATQQSIVRTEVYDAWRTSLTRTPFPGEGCFKASFPSTTWLRVACSTPPNRRFPKPVGQGILPDNVGDGHDFTAEVAPNIISRSVGSFPAVTGVRNVRSVPNPKFGGKQLGPNSYSLQLNSNLFTTASCAGLKHCVGWEQFIYWNPSKGAPYLDIQYWLVYTLRGAPFKYCPPNHDWAFVYGECVANSPQAVTLPNQPIRNLANFSLTAKADLSGDSIYFSTRTDLYGTKVHGAAITDLANGWHGAEFNVFGQGGLTIAKFNAGSTITVSLETDTGVRTAPKCPGNTGTTGESNSLSFVRAPLNPSDLPFPSILFTESNAQGGGSASCDRLEGSK